MSLPPTPAPGASILAWARRAAEWMRSQRLVAGPGILLRSSSSGTVISTRTNFSGSGAGATTCRAFFATEVRNVGEVPHLFLATGQVTGGTGSEAYDVDLCAVGSEPEDGTCVWLEITGDGYVEDGVLLPGFDVTGVTHGSGSSMPDQVPPTVEDDTGAKAYVLLGSWNGGAFTAAACGNVNVTFCPGSFSFSRF